MRERAGAGGRPGAHRDSATLADARGRGAASGVTAVSTVNRTQNARWGGRRLVPCLPAVDGCAAGSGAWTQVAGEAGRESARHRAKGWSVGRTVRMTRAGAAPTMQSAVPARNWRTAAAGIRGSSTRKRWVP
jgi:hypothetical protein